MNKRQGAEGRGIGGGGREQNKTNYFLIHNARCLNYARPGRGRGVWWVVVVVNTVNTFRMESDDRHG